MEIFRSFSSEHSSKILLIVAPLLMVLMLSMGYTSEQKEEVLIPYPEGYRNWTHVKSEIVGPTNPMVRYRGLHHIYANEKAMQGYQTGDFPEGSVIVFDLLETKQESYSDIKEGERKFIDVMVKDQKYDSTGGWGFEEFIGNSLTERSILHLSKPKCANCHLKQPGMVFSKYRR